MLSSLFMTADLRYQIDATMEKKILPVYMWRNRLDTYDSRLHCKSRAYSVARCVGVSARGRVSASAPAASKRHPVPSAANLSKTGGTNQPSPCAGGFLLAFNGRDVLSVVSDSMRIIPWAKHLAPTISSFSVSTAGQGLKPATAENTGLSTAMSTSWATLFSGSIAKHKHDPTAKYCQLATAAIGGGASCRTWVFRGFWEDTGALKFITDRRSEKVGEIAAAPAGEVVFYLRKTREQFRVKGRLQVIGASETDEKLAKARKHQWTQISPSSQASFATSLIPGEEISKERERGAADAEDTWKSGEGYGNCDAEQQPPKNPVDEFCLVLLWPHLVDHLELKDGQRRHVHTLVGDFDGGGVPLRKDGTDEGKGGRDRGVKHALEWRTVAVNP